MGAPVIAIIGAGASHASGTYAADQRPPLTKTLFEAARSQDLLKIYTLAGAAGTVIRREMATDSTVAFEEALRRIQDDGFAHHAQMTLAVAPFLQALLLEYSERLRADAFRYSVLVDEMLKLPTIVHFVSLNYDMLLDSQLAAFSPLATLDDYINTQVGWSLIKPHGSVAWYVEQPDAFDPKAPPRDMEVASEPIDCEPVSGLELSRLRASSSTDPHGPTTRYPALALPDGSKDELVLPTQHREYFLGALEQAPEIHLLVVGYSALDTEVLGLIARSGCKVRRLTVVNADAEAALEVYNRIRDFGIKPIWSDVFDGSFEDWIDGDPVRTWVAEYNRRFDSIIEPDEVQKRIAERKARAIVARQSAEPSILDQQF